MEIKLQKRFAKYLFPSLSIFALLSAIALVSVNLASTQEVRTVLVATKDLPEGSVIQVEDFTQVKLPLGSIAPTYLSQIEPELRLLQSVSKGELLSRSKLTKETDVRIPIRLNGLRPISKVIGVGDRVDIWATEQSSGNQSEPQPVVFGAIVTVIESDNSMTQSYTNIEIRISEDYLESLLTATDSNYQLSVILHETLADVE